MLSHDVGRTSHEKQTVCGPGRRSEPACRGTHRNVWAPIAPLVPIVDILVRILTPVIRAVAAVFAWVADVVVGIWNAIAKTINALLGWLGVHIPTIDEDWRKDYGLDKDQGGKAGTQISEITGPTRDLLVELMRP